MSLFRRKNPVHQSIVDAAQINAMTCLQQLRKRYPRTAGPWEVHDFVLVMAAASAFAAGTSLSTVTTKRKFEKGLTRLRRNLADLDSRGPDLLDEVWNFATQQGILAEPRQAMQCLGVWVVGMLLGRAPESDEEFEVAALAGASAYHGFWRWFE